MPTKILIIDDEESSLRMLKMLLEKEKFEITLANDGQDGVNLFKKQLHEIVITDIFMPNKEGLEIIQEVKAFKPDTYVVAITGYPNSRVNYLEIAKTFGADAVYEKPLDTKRFVQELNALSAK